MADQKKLAIVVGAGASKEYSLPIGSELKAKISKLLDIRFDRTKGSGSFITKNSRKK